MEGYKKKRQCSGHMGKTENSIDNGHLFNESHTCGEI